MKMAEWRRRVQYGLVIGLCQLLVACGGAETTAPVQKNDGRAAEGVGTGKGAAGQDMAADAPLVVAFGDSLYAGYQLAPKEGLAPQLQAALTAAGVTAHVHNAGVSGDTSAAGLQRLRFVLDNLDQKPALMLVGLGGNDMLRGIGPDQTRANLTAMLDELAKRKIPVVLTGMLAAPNMGRDYGAKFEEIFPDLGKRDGVTLYPFILDGVVGNPDLMLGDHIHPNAKGVQKIAASLAGAVAKQLPVPQMPAE